MLRWKRCDASPVRIIDIEIETLADSYMSGSVMMKLAPVTEQEVISVAANNNHVLVLNCASDR
jgi:hypothetical protein